MSALGPQPHAPTAEEKDDLCRDIRYVLDSPAFFSARAPAVARALRGESGPPPSEAECLDDAFCRAWRRALAPAGGEPFLESVAARVWPALPHIGGRLGLLFERIVVALLREGPETVLTDVAVRTGEGPTERTLGAFDALVFPRDSAVEHWEMAVKFYLQTHASALWNHCVGPGVRDRLDLKGTKTFLQQLPLSSTQAGRAVLERALEAHGASPHLPVRMRAFTKGTVFYRWPAPIPPAEPRASPHVSARLAPQDAWKASLRPDGLAPGHAKSWWVAPTDAPLLCDAFPEARLVALPRLRWLGGVSPEKALLQGESWDAFLAALPTRLEALEARSECLLVGVHDPVDGRERARGFIATPRFLRDAGLS